MDYKTANSQLTGRCDTRRKIANNTYLERRGTDGAIAVKLHATDIIVFHSNGDIVLDSGGRWKTVTTKARMNEYLSGYSIVQSKGQWYLYSAIARGPFCMYEDNMVIHADGTLTGGRELDSAKAELKLRRQAQKYGKDFVAALMAGNVPAPGHGDCWYCLMRESTEPGTATGILHADGKLHNQANVNPGMTGRTLGEINRNSDHILSHIEEKYYVPSLLVRAFETFGASQVMKWAVAEKWYPEQLGNATGNGHTFFDSYTSQSIAKSISRYVIRQLGQAA